MSKCNVKRCSSFRGSHRNNGLSRISRMVVSVAVKVALCKADIRAIDVPMRYYKVHLWLSKFGPRQE